MKQLTKLIILIFSLATFSQSPWTQEKGKYYTQISYTSISNYSTLIGEPDYNTEREITDRTIQFFAEYSLSSKTSLLVNIPFKMISTGDLAIMSGINVLPPAITISDTKNSLGNIEVGIKHNFYKKDWVLSGQLSVEANTSRYNNASGIRTGYNAWSFTPMFLTGRGFGKTYIQAFVGAHIRTNNYSSNFRFGGEIGRKFFNSVWVIGFFDVSSSLKNGNINLSAENLATGLYVNDQEFGAYGLKAILEFTNSFGINASYGGAFSGNNVAKRAALSFGLYQKF